MWIIQYYNLFWAHTNGLNNPGLTFVSSKFNDGVVKYPTREKAEVALEFHKDVLKEFPNLKIAKW